MGRIAVTCSVSSGLFLGGDDDELTEMSFEEYPECWST